MFYAFSERRSRGSVLPKQALQITGMLLSDGTVADLGRYTLGFVEMSSGVLLCMPKADVKTHQSLFVNDELLR